MDWGPIEKEVSMTILMSTEKTRWQVSEPEESELPLLAAMVAARVRAQRKAVPVLPEQYVSGSQVLPLVTSLFQTGGVRVARENHRIVGFLGGWEIPQFQGDRNGVFVPEYGFGSDSLEPEHAGRVFECLYGAQCARWCAAGALNHAVITYDEERHFREKLFHGGFGGVCIDAVRPAVALRLPVPADIRIREVRVDDPAAMHAWWNLCGRHHDYMRAAPMLLGSAEETTGEDLVGWIQLEKHHAWIAEDGKGIPVSYLQLEMKTDGTSMLVDNPRNMAVTGAFTIPEARGSGLATLLLDAALSRAVSFGMTSVSVDFESRNWPAERFWTRHFTPFTFSVLRQVDARAI